MRWGKYFKEAMKKMGRTLPEIYEYKGLIEAAGFVDVQEVNRNRPSNDWPKDPKLKEIGMVSMPVCSLIRTTVCRYTDSLFSTSTGITWKALKPLPLRHSHACWAGQKQRPRKSSLRSDPNGRKDHSTAIKRCKSRNLNSSQPFLIPVQILT